MANRKFITTCAMTAGITPSLLLLQERQQGGVPADG